MGLNCSWHYSIILSTLCEPRNAFDKFTAPKLYMPVIGDLNKSGGGTGVVGQGSDKSDVGYAPARQISRFWVHPI